MSRRRPAFTLIELLVVIAILGLLIAMLMPTLSAARHQAKAKLCFSNLRTLGTAITFYTDENKDQLPPFRLKQDTPDGTEDYVNEFYRRKPRWQWFLDFGEGPVINPAPFQRYIDSDGSFGDESVGRQGELGTTMTSLHFKCPSLGDEFEFDIRDGAYGYNYQYLGNARTGSGATRWDNFPVGAHRLRAAGRTVLFADSRGAGRRHGKHSYTLDPPRLAVERNADRFGPSDDDVPDGQDPALYKYSPAEPRHNSLANVVFFDTHAEAMSLKQLGYQFNGDGVAEPVDPRDGAYTASNKMWTGEGRDRLASKPPP